VRHGFAFDQSLADAAAPFLGFPVVARAPAVESHALFFILFGSCEATEGKKGHPSTAEATGAGKDLNDPKDQSDKHAEFA